MKSIAVFMMIFLTGVTLIAQEHHQPRLEELRTRKEHAQRQKPEQARFPEYGEFPMLARLDLTDNQKEQIRTIRHNNQLEMIDLRAETAKLRIRIKDALYKNDFRNAKRYNDQLFTKKGEMAKKGIELREQIHQILTEEQRKQLREAPHDRPRRKGGGCDDCGDCDHD